VSGGLLALEPMLPDWSAPHAGEGPPQPAGAIVAAAEAASGRRALRYVPAGEAGAAATVFLQGAALHVDPADLRVLGPAGGGAWAALRSLHVQFAVPEYGGRSIGGWFGVFLLLLLATGVPIWWPRAGEMRAGFTVPLRARGFRLHRRLHGAVGIWIFLPLLVLTVTGVALAFPRGARGLIGLEGGGPPRAMRAPGAAGSLDLDRAVTLAQAAAPGARLRMALLPAAPGEALRVFLVHPGGEGAAAMVAVQVDQAGTRVLAVQDARAAPAADRAWRGLHDLHEGAGLGPLWRIATVLAGIAMGVFAVTGPWMWWLRRRSRRRLDLARRAAMAAGQ
jgi:sulfite reductase (NADPH) flavoprotein alpha-component